MTIDREILLDTATPRLGSVSIVSGGRLVFSPDEKDATVKLTANHVRIQDGGKMEIGSDDCRFKGKAEVLLTGEVLEQQGRATNISAHENAKSRNTKYNLHFNKSSTYVLHMERAKRYLSYRRGHSGR